jgi:MFS family permease
MWTWMAAFASASLGLGAGETPSSVQGSAVAFVAIGSGALGSAAAGFFADRIGKARVAAGAMVVSAACCAAAGLVFGASFPVLLLFAAVWGVAVVADSAQLSALVAQYSPRDHVGTALTIQTCVGFLLTMASIRLLPVVARAIGWQWVFVCLLRGPVSGAIALGGLMRAPAVRSPTAPSERSAFRRS